MKAIIACIMLAGASALIGGLSTFSPRASASGLPTNEQIGMAREKLLFDFGWRFHLGNAASSKDDFGFGTGAMFAKDGQAIGAARPEFNDSDWRLLDLPHDWAVEQDFVNVPDDNVKDHGYKPIGRDFPATTIGWYRRTFN
ncbi:MAG TPA: beta-galactosidase, partial [Blastocatellia bacterium]